MRAPVVGFKRARRLRREMTFPEVLLWQALRKDSVCGAHFRKQHPCGPYVLDFYCSSARLAIEVDGAAHDLEGRSQRDQLRDHWLATKGIRVMRFVAGDVLDARSRQDVLETIAAAIEANTT